MSMCWYRITLAKNITQQLTSLKPVCWQWEMSCEQTTDIQSISEHVFMFNSNFTSQLLSKYPDFTHIGFKGDVSSSCDGTHVYPCLVDRCQVLKCVSNVSVPMLLIRFRLAR